MRNIRIGNGTFTIKQYVLGYEYETPFQELRQFGDPITSKLAVYTPCAWPAPFSRVRIYDRNMHGNVVLSDQYIQLSGGCCECYR